jgi:NADH:ubiquinone oxidoreductase subunit 3 (subunit A)
MVDYTNDIIAVLLYVIALVVNYLGDYTATNIMVVISLTMIAVVISFAGRFKYD